MEQNNLCCLIHPYTKCKFCGIGYCSNCYLIVWGASPIKDDAGYPIDPHSNNIWDKRIMPCTVRTTYINKLSHWFGPTK